MGLPKWKLLQFQLCNRFCDLCRRFWQKKYSFIMANIFLKKKFSGIYSFTKKAIWHFAIWQNWCFGQLYQSRIGVLQSCSAFLSQFLWREENSRERESFFFRNLGSGRQVKSSWMSIQSTFWSFLTIWTSWTSWISRLEWHSRIFNLRSIFKSCFQG